VTLGQIIVLFQLIVGLRPFMNFDFFSFVLEGFPRCVHEESEKYQAASDCGIFDIDQLRASFQGSMLRLQ